MFEFEDADSGDTALVIVRRAGDLVGLAVSMKHGADVEVFFGSDIALGIANALRDAATENPDEE